MENNVIMLTDEQRKQLEEFSKNGVHNAHLIARAKTILKLDRSTKKDHLRINRICEEMDLSRQAVNDIRKAFLEAPSMELFLQRKKRETPPVPPKVTGEVEAHIIAIACSEKPEGRARWTAQLIADECVRLELVDNLSEITVRRLLKNEI